MSESKPKPGTVVAVALHPEHRFSKRSVASIELVAGIGIRGDAHAGVTVKHRSRVGADPSQPNLRQVHLIHAELLDELRGRGFDVAPSRLGENITTRDIDLLSLPRGTRLTIGATSIEVTGLRNPCKQLDEYAPGLLEAVIVRHTDGSIERRAGIMAIVKSGGSIQPGDSIDTTLPPAPHLPLERV